MKKHQIIIVLLLVIVLLSSCACKHEWIEASCDSPKMCNLCHETEGEKMGHVWLDATCTQGVTCSLCGEVAGNPLSHNWIAATCTETKTCAACGLTEGEPLEHEWNEATCTVAKTCSICDTTEGEPKEHAWVDATCTSPETCEICGETRGNVIGHDYGQKAIDEVTCTQDGTHYMECINCGDEYAETIKALGHDWIDATYESPQYCSRCGLENGEPLFDTSDLRYIVAAHCYQNVLDQAKFPSTVIIERAYYTASNSAGWPMVVLECSAANSLGGRGAIFGVSLLFTTEEYENKYGSEGDVYSDVNFYFNSEYYITCSTYDSSPIHSPSGELLLDNCIMLEIDGIFLTYETINFV